MEFTLTVNLDKLSGDSAHELSRVLRYWAGAFKDADLKPNSSMNVYDTRYKKVGRWSITDGATPHNGDSTPHNQVPNGAAPQPEPELPAVPGQPDHV